MTMTKDNRRGVFIGLGVVAFFGALIAVIVILSDHHASEYDHAKAACTTWRSVVTQATDGYRPLIGDLDHMVAEAEKAAAADPRYTKLWSDMREYRLFASQGMNTTHLDYVSNDCANI